MQEQDQHYPPLQDLIKTYVPNNAMTIDPSGQSHSTSNGWKQKVCPVCGMQLDIHGGCPNCQKIWEDKFL